MPINFFEFQIHYFIAQIAEYFKLTKINICIMCNVKYSKLHPQNMWTELEQQEWTVNIQAWLSTMWLTRLVNSNVNMHKTYLNGLVYNSFIYCSTALLSVST